MLQVLRHKACFMTLAILSFVYIDCRVVRKVHNAGLSSSRQGQNNRGSLFTHAAVCFLYIAGLCLGCLWVIQYIVMQVSYGLIQYLVICWIHMVLKNFSISFNIITCNYIIMYFPYTLHQTI